jgi:hypothetical protein
MPFVPFIGINHYGESIILGCGLLSGEGMDSFVWVFRQWLQSMCGIAPKAIITDQCQAMRRVIEIVFFGNCSSLVYLAYYEEIASEACWIGSLSRYKVLFA